MSERTSQRPRLPRTPWKLIGGALVAAVLILFAAVGASNLLNVDLNPFGTEEKDRSQPALLESIRDLSQYHAAVGDFQVVIDVEKDVKLVPSALAGQRTLFVAAGTVNAFVDFSGMTGDGLTISPDGTSVEVRLPDAKLDKPNLDQERSYVFAQQRGVFDRLADVVGQPADQQQFYVLAEQKIADAATQAKITEQAEKNTRAMLTGMLGALGYRVTFADSD
ncbi:MAG TPA: DUF4230 domain-containing protein [Pseudonocardiaceae bacterium]